MSDSALTSNTVPVSSVRSSVWRRLVKNPLAVVALVIIAVVILCAILAPLLTNYDPNRADLSAVFAPPFGEHVLGADSAGRDVWSRLVYGARTSLLGALIALSVAILVGIPSGLIAGYYQGWFDGVASWFANMLMSMPGLIVLLAAIAVLGPQMATVMAIFGILLSPGVFRLTRTTVLTVRKELFVDAARVSGLSDARIISRHILGVVRAPLLIQGAMMAGIAIVLQAGLEFLGVGDPSTPSWGGMLSDAFLNIYIAPWLLVWPGLAIGLTTAAFAILGTALRDAVQGTDLGASKTKSRAVPELGAEHPGIRPAPASDRLLDVRDLKVGYPVEGGGNKIVVDGVSLHVDRGQVLGLVGESGSGKSQTAFAIMGLLPHGGAVLDGSISFRGEDLGNASRREFVVVRGTGIGYVPQEPMTNLDPCFTLGHQLVEPMRFNLGLSRSKAKARALELLDRVGIVDPLRTFDAYPHEVSGGMAQRVLIAGAVSCDPELIIADEPTTALDVTVQAEVLDLLRSLQRERGMGMILVTHNFGVVADICDRVAVMQQGRIVESNSAEALFADPQHVYTRMLLDSMLDDAPARGARVKGGQQ